jgi:hypothetical protein
LGKVDGLEVSITQLNSRLNGLISDNARIIADVNTQITVIEKEVKRLYPPSEIRRLMGDIYEMINIKQSVKNYLLAIESALNNGESIRAQVARSQFILRAGQFCVFS